MDGEICLQNPYLLGTAGKDALASKLRYAPMREDGEMPNEMGWYEPMGKMVVIIGRGKYMS